MKLVKVLKDVLVPPATIKAGGRGYYSECKGEIVFAREDVSGLPEGSPPLFDEQLLKDKAENFQVEDLPEYEECCEAGCDRLDAAMALLQHPVVAFRWRDPGTGRVTGVVIKKPKKLSFDLASPWMQVVSEDQVEYTVPTIGYYGCFAQADLKPAEAKPPVLTIKPLLHTQLELTWTAVPNTPYYLVEEKIGDRWEVVVRLNGEITSLILGRLAMNSMHTYRISAVGPDNALLSSEPISCRTARPVAAMATATLESDKRITLIWQAIAVNSQGYRLEMKVNDTTWTPVTTTQERAYTFPSPANPGKYTFRVVATDLDGCICYSNEPTVDVA